jgi:hypothetical protein
VQQLSAVGVVGGSLRIDRKAQSLTLFSLLRAAASSSAWAA